MDRFTSRDLEKYRAEALFYLAHPDYRNGEGGLVYSSERVNAGVLAAIIQATPENIARHLGEDGMKQFADGLAEALGDSREEILHARPEVILGAVEGEDCFTPPAVDYIEDSVLGSVSVREKVHGIVSPETLNSYAWQRFEYAEAQEAGKRLGYPVASKLLSLKLTKSLKGPKLQMGHTPRDRQDRGRPFDLGTVKFGKGERLERDLRSFAAETVIPIARRNLRHHYESELLTPEMFQALSRHSAESARVLGVH